MPFHAKSMFLSDKAIAPSMVVGTMTGVSKHKSTHLSHSRMSGTHHDSHTHTSRVTDSRSRITRVHQWLPNGLPNEIRWILQTCIACVWLERASPLVPVERPICRSVVDVVKGRENASLWNTERGSAVIGCKVLGGLGSRSS